MCNHISWVWNMYVYVIMNMAHKNVIVRARTHTAHTHKHTHNDTRTRTRHDTHAHTHTHDTHAHTHTHTQTPLTTRHILSYFSGTCPCTWTEGTWVWWKPRKCTSTELGLKQARIPCPKSCTCHDDMHTKQFEWKKKQNFAKKARGEIYGCGSARARMLPTRL